MFTMVCSMVVSSVHGNCYHAMQEQLNSHFQAKLSKSNGSTRMTCLRASRHQFRFAGKRLMGGVIVVSLKLSSELAESKNGPIQNWVRTTSVPEKMP